MKIVIQRGDLVNRHDISNLFNLLPMRCKKEVQTVVVYASSHSELEFQYHDKGQQLSVHSPANATITKSEALKEIGIALLAIADHKAVPIRLKKSIVKELENQWLEMSSGSSGHI